MADTFQYKRSETTSPINASFSPNLNVAVNNQAGKAFDNISRALGAYSQAKVQQLNTERQLTDEEVARLDGEAYVESSARMSTYYSQYADESLRAGTDREKQELAHDYFVQAMGMEVEELSPKVRERLALHANSMVKNADITLSKELLKIDRTDFLDNISVQAPAFLSMDTATQKEVYNDFMQRGEDLGISKSDFGSNWVSTIANYKINTIDVEKMVNETDYSQLDDIRATLDNIKSVDPKTNKDILRETKRLDELKNQIDSGVTKNITLALSSNERYSDFKDRLQFAEDNGAINEDRKDLYLRKWRDNNTVAQNAITGQAGSIWASSKGRANLSMFDGTKLKTPLTNMTKQETIRALMEGDSDYLQFQKDNNSQLFSTIVNEYTRDLTSKINNALTTKTSTPEQQQQLAQATSQLTENLNKAKFLGGSSLDTETALMARGTQLAAQGYIDPAKFVAMSSMYQPELAPKASVKDIYKDYDVNTAKAIHRDYSVLVASGLDKDLAMTEAKAIHAYIESEDTTVTISGSLNKALTNAQLPEGSTGAFITSLLEQPDYQDRGYDEVFADFQTRENPTIDFNNGALILKAEDGYFKTLPMPTALLTDAATAAREAVNIEKHEGTSNTAKVVDKAATYVSKDVLSFWNTLGDIGFMVKQGAEPIVGIGRATADNYTSVVMPLIEKQKQLVDTFLGEAFLEDGNFAQASDNFIKESVKTFRQLPVPSLYKGADTKQSKENLTRWNKIKEREITTIQEYVQLLKDVTWSMTDEVEKDFKRLTNQ